MSQSDSEIEMDDSVDVMDSAADSQLMEALQEVRPREALHFVKLDFL